MHPRKSKILGILFGALVLLTLGTIYALILENAYWFNFCIQWQYYLMYGIIGLLLIPIADPQMDMSQELLYPIG